MTAAINVTRRIFVDGADYKPAAPLRRRNGVMLDPNRNQSHWAKQRRSLCRTIPKKCYPLTIPLWRAMIDQMWTYENMEKRSGVSVWALMAWRKGRCPDLRNFEACLNVVGLRLNVSIDPISNDFR